MIIDDFDKRNKDRMNEGNKLFARIVIIKQLNYFENRGRELLYIENTRRATSCLPILFVHRERE